jgi:hypothetical protein
MPLIYAYKPSFIVKKLPSNYVSTLNMPARSLSEKLAKLVLASPNSENFDNNTKHYFFTRSQIRTKGWLELNTKEQRIEAINTLINRGYISEPLSERYFINPIYLNE